MTEKELIEKVEEIRVHEICASREDCKGCPFDDGNYNCCLAMTIEALERLINADENLKKLEEDQAEDIREENGKGI